MAEHTLGSIGDYPIPQAPNVGGGQSPSEGWHSQPVSDGCPEGRLSSRVRHGDSQEPRGPGVLGPSTCRCWRLRCRVLNGGQRRKQSPITGSDTRITGMALVLCHCDCTPSASWPVRMATRNHSAFHLCLLSIPQDRRQSSP